MSEYILNKSGVCRRCELDGTATLHRVINQGGGIGYSWICDGCETANPYGGDHLIAKEKVQDFLTPDQFENLPVKVASLFARCAKCSCRGAELNHWMPIAVAGKEEADKWPQDYLCKDCHDEWHRKVTPYLVNPTL